MTSSTPTTSRRTRPAAVRLLAPVLAAALLCTPAAASAADGSTTASSSSGVTSGLFSTKSAWRTDVTKAPVSTRSSAMVRNLTGQVRSRYGGTAAFNVWKYNTGYAVAGSSQKTADVKFDDCQGKGYTPSVLYGSSGPFTKVPIPADAVPALGTDRHLAVYSPSKDQLWEFWKAVQRSDGWHACWGGRIDHVSTSKGFFAGNYGASASGLSVAGGTLGIQDASVGRADHALALAIPDIAYWKDVSWPAQRSDGGDRSSDAIPMGTRFRLDPTLDVDKLGLTPVGRTVARAAQKYGFIVTDTAGAVSVTTESGAAAKKKTGSDPWKKILGGTPSYQVLANFPWDKLQAMPEDWGAPKS